MGPDVSTTSIILSSTKIQNRDILVPAYNNNNAIYIAQIRAHQQMGCRVISVQIERLSAISNDMSDNCKSFGRLFHTEGP